MSAPVLLGEYRPGTTWLHRLGPGSKLLGLCGCAILLVAVRWPPLAVTAVLAALGLALASGIGWREAGRTLRGVMIVAVLLGAWLVWQHGWSRAVDSVGDLLALVLLASVLTRTTSVEAMLDTVTRGLVPLRRFGADPARTALTFSLMIRLFGNMMSHEFVIAIVVLLAGLLLPIPFLLLGVLIGVIQAYIFTILTAVYINSSLSHH